MHINDVDMVTPPEPGHCPESIHEVKQMYTISFVLSMLLLGRGWRNIGHWTVFMKLGNISIWKPTYLYMYKGSTLCVFHAYLVEFACCH